MSSAASAASAASVQVDEAVYDTGINWCWFTIRCGGDVARFRMHMAEAPIWKLFELLDAPSLHPDLRSGLGFRYGSSERRDSPACEGEATRAVVPPAFAWLEEFLAGQHGAAEARFSATWCAYHGVDFYRATQP